MASLKGIIMAAKDSVTPARLVFWYPKVRHAENTTCDKQDSGGADAWASSQHGLAPRARSIPHTEK